jgi:branched-chain amino acid transport system ATP-binding protein
MTMLRIDQMHVHYGAVHALRGVTMHVNEGEIVTLIGANGAGKSTLMNCIFGVPRPSAGDILFEGQSITKVVPHLISRLGIALSPEGRRIFARMTVAENLQTGAIHADASYWQQDLDRIFAMFPILEKRREQRAGTLSGGEQQMLAIARGMMSKPRILLLDEPSLGLAPAMINELFDVLADLRDEGVTILLVDQMAVLALAVADRGYVIDSGRFVREDSAANLAHDPEVEAAYLGHAEAAQ